MNALPPDLARQIRSLVMRMLKLPESSSIEPRRADTPQWDSLRHMEIVFALEDRYGVQFDEADFASLDSPEAIARMVRQRRAA